MAKFCADCVFHSPPGLFLSIVSFGTARDRCAHLLASDEVGSTDCVEMRRPGAPCGPVAWLFDDGEGNT